MVNLAISFVFICLVVQFLIGREQGRRAGMPMVVGIPFDALGGVVCTCASLALTNSGYGDRNGVLLLLAVGLAGLSSYTVNTGNVHGASSRAKQEADEVASFIEMKRELITKLKEESRTEAEIEQALVQCEMVFFLTYVQGRVPEEIDSIRPVFESTLAKKILAKR